MKMLWVPLGLLLMLMAALRLLLGRDEPATVLARAWDVRPPVRVADDENAWFWLLGQGAAPVEEPVAFARRRLAAHEARVALGPAFWRDNELARLAEDPVPFVAAPEATSPYARGGCPARDVDCIAWAERYATSLDLLEQANALRLERYAQARRRVHYQDLGSPSLSADLPVYAGDVPRLYMDLIVRDAARGEDPQRTLARLAALAAFWRRNAEQSEGLLAKRFGDSQLERSWRIARDLLAAHPALATSPDATALLAKLWQPPSAAYRALDGHLRWTHQALVQEMEEAVGADGLPADCLRLKAGSCVENLLIGSAYAPQATRNLSAATWALIQSGFEADAREYRRVLDANRVPFNALHPVFEGDFVSLFSDGNPSGRVLVAIAIPAYLETIENRHDTEGLRRLFELLHLARMDGVEPRAMHAFLDRQLESRRDPYTGEAFGWNPLMRELWFAPRSAQWQRPFLTVAWPGAPAESGAFACAAPVELRLRPAEGAEQAAHACGARDDASVLGPVSDDEEALGEAGSLEYMTVAASGNHAAVRMAWRDPNHRLLAYEALDLEADGNFKPMRPLGHAGDMAWSVSATPYLGGPMVKVLFEDTPADEIARQAIAAAEVSVVRLGPVCQSRVTLDFSAIPLRDVLLLLGDECGFELKGDAPAEWHYVRWQSSGT
jgi:hypothetical protein